MRGILLVLTSLIVVSGTAHAQTQVRDTRLSQTDIGNIYASRNAANWQSGDTLTCLVRKSTKRRECRTQSEWKRVAQRLSASEQANP